LKPYASFAQAVEAPDLLAYIQDLRKHYPPRAAEELLESLKREDAADDRSGSVAGPEFHFDAPAPVLAKKEAPIYKIRNEGTSTLKETAALPPTLPPGSRLPVSHSASPAAAKSSADRAAPRPAASVPSAPVRPRPTSPTPPSRPALAPLPAASPAARASAGLSGDEADFPPGAWLPAMLFGILLTGGLLLAGYTLLRPFFRGPLP
jgi:hypothetical protein